MKTKKLLICSLAISLSACTSFSSYMAGVNDKALKTSENTICKGASVGSVLRRYDTDELVEAWRKLCLHKDDKTPIKGSD